MNPGHILIGTRLIQIEDQSAGKHLCSGLRNLHRAPWRIARGLHIPFPSLGIRSEKRSQGVGLLVHVEVHAGIIDESRLVDAHIQS